MISSDGLTDPTFISTVLYPSIGPFNYMTQLDPARLQLLGANDEIVADYTINLGGVSSSFIVGLFSKYIPGGGGLFGGPVTFSGLRTVVNVGDYVGIPQTVLTFNSASIGFADPSFDGPRCPTCAPGGIPEPATWAILILGFGATGTVIRRRRALPAA